MIYTYDIWPGAPPMALRHCPPPAGRIEPSDLGRYVVLFVAAFCSLFVLHVVYLASPLYS